jgi:hypothetical protein
MNIFKKYCLNLLLGIDQLGNCIWGGDPDETISSRIGRIKLANGGKVPSYRPVVWLIDKMLDEIDPGHSIDAVEPGQGSDGIFDRKK